MGRNGVVSGTMQLEVCGAKVDLVMSGSGERAALLLHGWGCSAKMMGSVADLLSTGMRVAALDFPGHGREGKALPPPEPWGVPEYMEMTAAIIRKLELAPCDIVAHSFGARVAILLASTYPELVGRMILTLSLIHISEPTRRIKISYAVFCLKKIFF